MIFNQGALQICFMKVILDLVDRQGKKQSEEEDLILILNLGRGI